MTYTICYKREGAVDIEADNFEEAHEKFDNMSESEKDGNTFGSYWEITDITEHA